jgi:small subunit ribosomal protein S17
MKSNSDQRIESRRSGELMERKVRDIGVDVKVPVAKCDDVHCPFHGKLSVRGQILDGVVVSTKMDKTAVVERNYLRYIKKFERYEKRTSRISAHCPPCLGVKVGDKVRIMECRPLSKTVSFVIIEKR